MSVEQVAKAAPKALHPGGELKLSPEAFDKAHATAPGLFTGRSASTGGNRFNKTKSIRSAWPVIDGARWSVEIDDRGLSRVRIHYESEAAALKALTSQFGPPTVSARWKIWASAEPGTRAVFTGCFQPTSYGKQRAPNECTVELSPFRPLPELITGELFPGGKTLLGRSRADYASGYVCGERCTTVQLKAYRSSSGSVPLELHWDAAGKLTGYRTQLDYTYEAGNRGTIAAEMKSALGPPETHGDCQQWANQVSMCERSSVFVITVGTIER